MTRLPDGLADRRETAARVEPAPPAGVAPPVIVVTGLAFEAKIAVGAAQGRAGRERSGLIVICQQNSGLAPMLEHALRVGARGIVSFGTAGGLAPGLAPGSWIVARHVLVGTARFTTDPAWSARLANALSGPLAPGSADGRAAGPKASPSNPRPIVYPGDLAGLTLPVVSATAKRALHLATGALAADMESAIAARSAAAHRLPFVCCRVVIDPAERDLPPAALAGLRANGTTDLFTTLRSLCAAPAQLPGLLRLAGDASRARSALQRGRACLGDDFLSHGPG